MAGCARTDARRAARAAGGRHRDRPVQARRIRPGRVLARGAGGPMRMFTALVGRSLARHRALIAGLTVVLSVMQILVVLAARNLQQDRMFAQIAALIPPFVQEALGGSMGLSFGGLV